MIPPRQSYPGPDQPRSPPQTPTGWPAGQTPDLLKPDLYEQAGLSPDGPTYSTTISPAGSPPTPNPLDRFPRLLRETIYEVAYNLSVQPEAAALATLTTFSAALKGRLRVALPYGQVSNAELYGLFVAESGDRKTSMWRAIAAPLYEHDERASEQHRLEMATYEADHLVWGIEQAALTKKLAAVVKQGKDSDTHKQALKDHARQEPSQPRMGRLVCTDISRRAVMDWLEGDERCMALVTDEGGLVLDENFMDQVSTLNSAWDGGPLNLDRAKGLSVRARNPHVTVLLMVQPAVLAKFIKRNGDVVRGSGFLSRFLISWPTSLKGERRTSNRWIPWRGRDAFHERLRGLLASTGSIKRPEVGVGIPIAEELAAEDESFKQLDLDIEEVRHAGPPLPPDARDAVTGSSTPADKAVTHPSQPEVPTARKIDSPLPPAVDRHGSEILDAHSKADSTPKHLNEVYPGIYTQSVDAQPYVGADLLPPTSRTDKITLYFDAEASQRFFWLARTIEQRQKPGRDLSEITDFASKFMENVARTAALFHYAESDTNFITHHTLYDAYMVVQYWLDETKRILIVDPYQQKSDQEFRKIESYLNGLYNDQVPAVDYRFIYRNGPVHSEPAVAVAIERLKAAGRVKVTSQAGQRKKVAFTTSWPQLSDAV